MRKFKVIYTDIYDNTQVVVFNADEIVLEEHHLHLVQKNGCSVAIFAPAKWDFVYEV
jgi:hypothetical protein